MVKYDQFKAMKWFSPKNLRPGGPPDAPKIYPPHGLGDRIERYNFGWHAGDVTELGSGKNQGEYLVKSDKFSTSQWTSPKDLRSAAVADAEKAETATIAATASHGPRVGKYDIFSYGTIRLYLGHVGIMTGQKYRVSRTSAGNHFGEGIFTFDSAGRKIQWTSGPYASAGLGWCVLGGATRRTSHQASAPYDCGQLTAVHCCGNGCADARAAGRVSRIVVHLARSGRHRGKGKQGRKKRSHDPAPALN